MQIGDVAGAIGKGIVAGLVGTAAMTVSSSLEAKLSGRGASTTPETAVEHATGLEASDQDSVQLVNQLAHWGYGISWGALRGLLAAAGLRGPAAGATHFAIVWGAEQVVLPALDVSPPTPSFGAAATATDVFHHAVYALATDRAYDWVDRRSTNPVRLGRR